MDVLVYFNMCFFKAESYFYLYITSQLSNSIDFNHKWYGSKVVQKKYVIICFQLFEYFCPLFSPPTPSLSTDILIKLRHCILQVTCVLIASSF